ncbi:hypothetical protein JB92DRAFT_2926390 [Gautieria morchelliformis]|nr:hypothetical protein JB92DRAFT_2926390 [Gautieria morchelliformis]
MGPSKKVAAQTQKAAKVPVPRNTRHRTRLHKPKLITDPAQSTLQLTNQLRGLGLYAAPTLGDGNCLFRALADQLWGSPSGHLTLRAEVCNWMEARKERYEGFVDEDRSFDTHIQCMRVPGTYGGHLELSAFSHLKRRNVKVIQPGLVYIIEWDCGWGADSPPPPVQEEPIDETGLNEREKRRLRRDRKKLEKEKEAEAAERSGTVYVAYHDWEHFSSVRNLAGPHTGLPNVVERPERPDCAHDEPSAPAPRGAGRTPTPRGKAKAKAKAPASVVITPSTPIDAIAPTQVPLPPSRSPSPSTACSSLSPPLSQAISSTSSSTAPSSLAPLTPPDISSLVHTARSPKRGFDECPGSASRPSATTKRRKNPSDTMDIDGNQEADENTPSLSDDSSSSGLTSLTSSSSSALSSPSPPTPPAAAEPEPVQKPFTRRQRKALGLPHPRTALASAGKTRSAGKIVIPGGRRMLRSSSKLENADMSGEWQTNGTGRLDVRGFRELKI